MDQTEIIASINIMLLPGGQTGVQLNAQSGFMEMSPVHRAVLVASVIQLCAAAIEAIIEDHPEDRDEIRHHLNALTLEPRIQTVN